MTIAKKNPALREVTNDIGTDVSALNRALASQWPMPTKNLTENLKARTLAVTPKLPDLGSKVSVSGTTDPVFDGDYVCTSTTTLTIGKRLSTKGYEIRSDIPLMNSQLGTHAKVHYPYAEMEVGESFFVPRKKYRVINTIPGKYFCTRQVTEDGIRGTRVWRKK